MNQGGGMGGGMGGMNPGMMMNPMMGMGMGADGMNIMNPMMGMPGMGMGGMGMGMGGMGMPNMGMPGGPQGGGGGPPSGGMGDMGDGKFYKTKICHKFMEGKCNYGPTCKYAHGEGDLRAGLVGGPPAPRPQGSGKVMTPHGPAMGGGGMQGPMGGMGMGPKPGMGGPEKGPHFRTRLCEQFMKEGVCRYGNTCTFAHGQHELRPFPGGGGGGGGPKGGNMPRPNNAAMGPQGAQKRPLDGQGPADAKRARTAAEPVVPPEQEVLPVEGRSMDLDNLRKRFEALQQEANRFARDTGHSVALFTVGGIVSDMDDTTDFAGDAYVQDVKKDNAPVAPNLKVSVLKYGTGGVAKHLITRGEIVKFVCARGTKALSELYTAAQGNVSA